MTDITRLLENLIFVSIENIEELNIFLLNCPLAFPSLFLVFVVAPVEHQQVSD
jgi:hypothetical protein